MSEIPLLKPLIKAPMTMTTVTPIATPRIVNAARILCARNDVNAMPTPSNSPVIRLLLPQRGDRIELRGARRGVHAEDDAHDRTHERAHEDGEGRNACGQRRDLIDHHGEENPRDDPEARPHERDRDRLREELARSEEHTSELQSPCNL